MLLDPVITIDELRSILASALQDRFGVPIGTITIVSYDKPVTVISALSYEHVRGEFKHNLKG